MQPLKRAHCSPPNLLRFAGTRLNGAVAHLTAICHASIPFAPRVNTKPKFLLFGKNILQTGLRQLWVALSSRASPPSLGDVAPQLCPPHIGGTS